MLTWHKERAEFSASRLALVIDIVLYLAVMFLIREVYFSEFGFIANGLFWSLCSLLIASWRMKVRGVSWQMLGLCMPKNWLLSLIAIPAVIVMTLGSIILFQVVKSNLGLDITPDSSNESATAKFGALKNNWPLFFSIIPLVWLQSMFEELLDRGFLMNWIERTMSSAWFITLFAVLAQALIFGFRHSYDFSERSITVALIGLAMGIGYFAFGRNLWPLIIVHCVLNTISMAGRVS